MKRNKIFNCRWLAILGMIMIALILGACSSVPALPKVMSVLVVPGHPDDLAVGDTAHFVLTGQYSGGVTAEVQDVSVQWKSSNTNVATIDVFGNVTGIAAGTTQITGANNGMVSPPATLNVVGSKLLSIVVTPATPVNITVGGVQQFTATATFADMSTADITVKATWSSTNPSAAPITSYGLVNGMASGKSDIVASLYGVGSPAVTMNVAAP